MKFFRISKWEKYQHYHKPRPPWLKIYTSINDIDTDWRSLTDAQLGQLIRLMAHAALNDNSLPFDGELVGEMLGCDQKLDLPALSKLGVITVLKDRSSCLSREKSRQKSREKSRQNPILPSTEVRGQRSEVDKEEEKKASAKKYNFAVSCLRKHNKPIPKSMTTHQADEIIDTLKDLKPATGARAPKDFPEDPPMTFEEKEAARKSLEAMK